jgi:bloom syndrome protein
MRATCDEIAAHLAAAGVSAAAYHAGLRDDDRAAILTRWLKDEIKVVCAVAPPPSAVTWQTVAFGMGIDKADVRFVVHHTMPKSVEGLYQEAGRGGRDGGGAVSRVYYGREDERMLRFLEAKKKRDEKEQEGASFNSVGGGGGGDLLFYFFLIFLTTKGRGLLRRF